MENNRASKKLNKNKTKFRLYFFALLKEGAYIERQIMIISGREVVSYQLKKDLHQTEERPYKNTIYGQLNFEAVKQFKSKGFKIREAKLKCYAGGQTEQFFFSDYQQPMFNYSIN